MQSKVPVLQPLPPDCQPGAEFASLSATPSSEALLFVQFWQLSA